ncbi:unnamed protein product [Rotaria sp. Silwood2]|nr:unnamed protein product [Rotaria sp. Silwood2]CAF3373315.1 unnamed protein product [Rotaria sp. Silwood2]CAF4521308.1 unnamed protein product [Rotaria sp. Silwood2]CAF4526648.1 unnamed protein product [Rotaria sp. Silwood2]
MSLIRAESKLVQNRGFQKIDNSDQDEIDNSGQDEMDDSGQDEQGNTHNYETESTMKTTSESTNSLDNNTKEILQWLKIQFDQSRQNDNNNLGYSELDYGDCFSYINASMLEAFHALESDNHLRFMFNEKFKKSCNDPCANFTQQIKNISQPISRPTCDSIVIISVNAKYKYEENCHQQLHVNVNKPHFIGNKLYWCLFIKSSELSKSIDKRNIQKHDTSDNKKLEGKLVLPHRGNRFHTKWSSLANNCLSPDIRLDNKFFCEITASDIIPESKGISDFDDLTQQLFLAEIIENIIDYDRVVNHNRIQHCDPLSFFYGHRRYLACVEKLLAKKSLPLPIWSPEIQRKIPFVLQGVKFSPHACLSSALCIDGWLDVPFAQTEINVSLPIELNANNICKQDLYTLHKKTLEYHGNLHNAIGGVFKSFDSPASPLFFALHNYIDKKIFKTWEQCSNDNVLFMTRLWS